MNRLFANASKCKLAAATVFTSVALLITGCGMGAPADPSPIVAGAITGRAMGGAVPISGAEVQIYATGTDSGNTVSAQGYGVATVLQEATQVGASAHQDTDAGGNFSFPGGYTCPTGQLAYIVITGGSAGGGANSDIVEVDALGRCEDLFSGTTYDGPAHINVNEATTIAAAYALGHFTGAFSSINGTGAGTPIGIGADATNNAAAIGPVSTGCVAGVAGCTTTASAGLYHAFLNAFMLVNSFAGDAATNTTGGGVVPTALINSIANVLTACVNSTGGTAGDDSTCGDIFTFTTIGSNVPANTFSAMVNLAANPTFSGQPEYAQIFLSFGSGYSMYAPALTSSATVNDLSIGINYPANLGPVSACSVGAIGATSATNCLALTCPEGLAIDINDNAYVGNSSAAACGTSPTNVISFSSNGDLLSLSPNSGTFKDTYGLSIDALGHGYYVQGNGSSTSGLLGVFAYSGGFVSAAPSLPSSGTGSENNWTAVDRNNNVWISANNGIWESAAGGALFTNMASGATYAIPAAGFRTAGLAIDPQQNIWDSADQTLYILPNNGTVGSPTYTAPLLTPAAPTVDDADGIVFTGSSSTNYTAYISGDAADNSTGTPQSGLQPYTFTLSGAQVTSPVAGANITGSIGGADDSAADGAGLVWMADSTNKAIIQVDTTGLTTYEYEPCLVASGACSNALAAGSASLYAVAVDSTGSIWTTTSKGSSVVQIIGAAAPTWPLLSLGALGMP